VSGVRRRGSARNSRETGRCCRGGTTFPRRHCGRAEPPTPSGSRARTTSSPGSRRSSWRATSVSADFCNPPPGRGEQNHLRRQYGNSVSAVPLSCGTARGSAQGVSRRTRPWVRPTRRRQYGDALMSWSRPPRRSVDPSSRGACARPARWRARTRPCLGRPADRAP